MKTEQETRAMIDELWRVHKAVQIKINKFNYDLVDSMLHREVTRTLAQINVLEWVLGIRDDNYL